MIKPTFRIGSFRVSHEARPLFDAPNNPAPLSDLRDLSRQVMRQEHNETDVVQKNRFAYDKVRDRIKLYQDHVNDIVSKRSNLAAASQAVLAKVDEPLKAVTSLGEMQEGEFNDPRDANFRYRIVTVDGRKQLQVCNVTTPPADSPNWRPYPFNPSTLLWSVGKLPYGMQYETYANASDNDRLSARTASGTGGELAPNEAARAMRVFWDVVRLETHYHEVETLIAGLERQAAPPLEEADLLKTKLKDRAEKRLNDAMYAPEDPANEIRTIHIDQYSKPLTEISERAYHLLRLPQGVGVTIVRRAGLAPHPINARLKTFTLSGGYQYLMLPPDFMKNEDFTRLAIKATGTPRGEVYATMTKTTDGLNNAIISFMQPGERPADPTPNPTTVLRTPQVRPAGPAPVPARTRTVPGFKGARIPLPVSPADAPVPAPGSNNQQPGGMPPAPVDGAPPAGGPMGPTDNPVPPGANPDATPPPAPLPPESNPETPASRTDAAFKALEEAVTANPRRVDAALSTAITNAIAAERAMMPPPSPNRLTALDAYEKALQAFELFRATESMGRRLRETPNDRTNMSDWNGVLELLKADASTEDEHLQVCSTSGFPRDVRRAIGKSLEDRRTELRAIKVRPYLK
jgi:hypothetical protein